MHEPRGERGGLDLARTLGAERGKRYGAYPSGCQGCRRFACPDTASRMVQNGRSIVSQRMTGIRPSFPLPKSERRSPPPPFQSRSLPTLKPVSQRHSLQSDEGDRNRTEFKSDLPLTTGAAAAFPERESHVPPCPEVICGSLAAMDVVIGLAWKLALDARWRSVQSVLGFRRQAQTPNANLHT